MRTSKQSVWTPKDYIPFVTFEHFMLCFGPLFVHRGNVLLKHKKVLLKTVATKLEAQYDQVSSSTDAAGRLITFAQVILTIKGHTHTHLHTHTHTLQ